MSGGFNNNQPSGYGATGPQRPGPGNRHPGMNNPPSNQNTYTQANSTQSNRPPPWQDSSDSANNVKYHSDNIAFIPNPNATNESGFMPREGWIPKGRGMGFEEVRSSGGEWGLPIGLQGFSTLGVDKDINYHFPAQYRALTITVVGCDPRDSAIDLLLWDRLTHLVAQKFDSQAHGGHVWLHEKVKRVLGCLPYDNSGLQFWIEGKDRVEKAAVEELYTEARRIWSMYNDPQDRSTEQQKDAVLPQGLPNCKDGQPPSTHHFELATHVVNVLKHGNIRIRDGVAPPSTPQAYQQGPPPQSQRLQLTYPGYAATTPSPQVPQWGPYLPPPPSNDPYGHYGGGRNSAANNGGWGAP